VTKSFTVIIPARLASTRLPDKVLLDIAGKTLLQHVYISACRSKASRVLIATENQQVFNTADSFGAECIMTSPDHISGTDRVAETISIIGLSANEIIVNLQADEIDMPPQLINQVADLLLNKPSACMATLYEPIKEERDISNPNVVKVVFDINNTALYFSRAAVPWHKTGMMRQYYRHIGIYAYKTEFLTEFTRMPRCTLEQSESLEQLRAIYHGAEILVDQACMPSGIGIDTKEDLIRARERITRNPGSL
jgi:3-deoxy-manno-octulosonate cytidylyltransferase (CMP-KDO synthetase)